MKANADFQWAFGLNRVCLNVIGIWPSEASDDRRGFKHLRIPMMVLTMLLCLFLPQMYALAQVFHELPLVVDNFTTNCAALTSSIKLFLFWNSRKVLEPVVRSAIADWSIARSGWEVSVMRKQARRARIFTISGYAIMFGCFVGFIASPIFGLSIRTINNITDPATGRFLPLQTYYPYEAAKSPYFELTYMSQLLAGSFVGISFSVPDNFFGALVFHACAQCEILRSDMTRILPSGGENVAKWTGNEKRYVRLKLRECVGTHVRLIRFIDAIENSFNLLILTQVLCLSMVICCLGFGVIKSVGSETEQPSVVQIVILSGTLLNLMVHMLIYCIASEILAEHSLGFFRAIYSSDWYLLPTTCARDIILVMIRSRIPLQLTAGKFFCLSLNAYLRILKSSIGYISMLLAVSN